MYDVVFNFKGTVYVISSFLPFKEWLFRLTTIPFTIFLLIKDFFLGKLIIFNLGFPVKVACGLLQTR